MARKFTQVVNKPVRFGGIEYGTHLAALLATTDGYVKQAVYSSSAGQLADWARENATEGHAVWMFNTDTDGERIGNPFAFVDVDGYHSYFGDLALPCACYCTKREVSGECPAHPGSLRPVSVAR